jgi:hypothetical protein
MGPDTTMRARIAPYVDADDDMTSLIALVALYGDRSYREQPAYTRVTDAERAELDCMSQDEATDRVAGWISDAEASI